MPVTGDQQLLKQINRMAIVRQVSSQPGLSRAALADVLGLTKSTVSLLVRELMDEGWLMERELLVTGELGRRATPLHLDPSRLALLGADLGVDEIRVVATNLLGEVVASRVVELDDAHDPAVCIKLMTDALVKLARKVTRTTLAAEGRRILGLGIGLYGGVDETLERLHYAPHLGWRNVDVGRQVRARLGGTLLDRVPLYMQNDANVSALAEFEFTEESGVDPLIFLSIGYGVGAGVVVSDRLLTGQSGFAGEVGHTILQVDGPLCSCGRRGCADALIGMDALVGRDPQRSAKANHAAMENLFEQALAGERATCAAVEAAGRQLGVLLNNLWTAFDPMAIVIGGPALRLGEALIGPARRVLGEYAQAAMLAAPAIRTSHFGADAVAVGGAALARYRLTRPLDLQSASRRADKARQTRIEAGLAAPQ
jgi:predicted NBD/HSP70 family sugar kinase